MGSKVFIVIGLLAATVLIVSDAAAVNSIKTTPASTFGFVSDLVNPQASCRFCGYIASSKCKCCVSGANTAEKDKADVDLVETTAASTAAGDQVNPQATCYYCGYILSGKCKCCLSAAQEVEKVEPKN